MKSKVFALLVSAVVSAAAVSAAQAGFLSAEVGSAHDGLTPTTAADWRSSVNAWTSLSTPIPAAGVPDLTVRIPAALTQVGGGGVSVTGAIDEDPPLTVTFPLTNSTSDTWVGIVIRITADSNSVLSNVSGTSTVFGNAVAVGTPSQYTLTYSSTGPSSVIAPGGSSNFTVNFQVDTVNYVTIGGGGPIGLFGYSFAVSAVVPEPSSVGFLAIGSLGLLARRRA